MIVQFSSMEVPLPLDRYAYLILTCVHDRGPCKKSDIYDYLGTKGQNVIDELNELIGHHLLEEKGPLMHNTKTISLTEKGNKVLGLMSEIGTEYNNLQDD